jgi:glycosyltransferase involved in cell wall biosynthesis
MISFIVSALNEEQNIRATVQTVVSAAEICGVVGYEIILIDDGSTDGTFSTMKDIGEENQLITLIHNEQNRGLGSAIRQGISVARHSRFMVVPGDNDMHQSLIEMLLTFRDRAEIILTIPLNRESRSLLRNIVSMIYQMVQMTAFGIYVNYINGPGIWPTEKARAAGLVARRFSIISELNVALLRTGCTYAEVPGYFQSRLKTRRTVTLKNFFEVVRLVMSLFYRVHIGDRKRFSAHPRRVHIDFIAKSNAAGAQS